MIYLVDINESIPYSYLKDVLDFHIDTDEFPLIVFYSPHSFLERYARERGIKNIFLNRLPKSDDCVIIFGRNKKLVKKCKSVDVSIKFPKEV